MQLRQFSFPLSSNAPLFAFQFTDRYPGCDGWAVYDAVAELKRQGLPNESWKISKINDQYEVCDTYPQRFGVPKLVNDDEVRETAKFRSKVRTNHQILKVHLTSCPLVCAGSAPSFELDAPRFLGYDLSVRAAPGGRQQQPVQGR